MSAGRTCKASNRKCYRGVALYNALLIVWTHITLTFISCPSPAGRRYGNRGCHRNATLSVRRCVVLNVSGRVFRQDVDKLHVMLSTE